MKRLLIYAALAGPLCAPANAQDWIADEHGCRVWDSTPTPNETVTWTGPCKNGLAHGKGQLTWYSKGSPYETYTGQLTDGHYTGYGTQIWKSGDRYDGNYLNDRPHGQGTYRSAAGEVFSGVWTNGCFREGDRGKAIGIEPSQCP